MFLKQVQCLSPILDSTIHKFLLSKIFTIYSASEAESSICPRAEFQPFKTVEPVLLESSFLPAKLILWVLRQI